MSLGVLLVAGMLLIVLSADYFTNGVEWLGYRLGLADGVVGSLLAALGTALPETLVPFMAFLTGGDLTQAIGLGAILGAPLMLSTLGFSLIGAGVWLSGRRREGLSFRRDSLDRDLRFFLAAFGAAVLAAWTPASWHGLIAAVLVGGYCLHAWRLLRGQGEGAGPPRQALHLWPSRSPALWAITGQVSLALFGLVVGAHFFVSALEAVAHWLKLSGFLVSVIITPVATELPELLNSVIWIHRRRDGLAVGNVSGALAFQASLVPALGLMLTPWHFTIGEMVTAVLAWGAGFWTWTRSRDGRLHVNELVAAGLFYALFIGLALTFF
ncbi:MAG: sodium:calcium antiporter [Firmicutes bacterium]|nr:sodium:calcium antiporter [Bacillota bacterium]